MSGSVSGGRSLPLESYLFTCWVQGEALFVFFEGTAPMTDNSKRTGAAIEVHYQFLAWLAPTIEKFPKRVQCWPIASVRYTATVSQLSEADRKQRGRRGNDAVDPQQTIRLS